VAPSGGSDSDKSDAKASGPGLNHGMFEWCSIRTNRTTSTHRIHQTARSGRCPIRKNRTKTLQTNYPQGPKNWLQRRVSQFTTICNKNQPPNLTICGVMATFVPSFFVVVFAVVAVVVVFAAKRK
jgi:hypothetical protein